MNSKPLQITMYIDGMNTGSLVLKAPNQHYKITGLQQILKLAAEREQFIRQVVAGAAPKSKMACVDGSGKKYDLELGFLKPLVTLQLWLATADGGKALMFEWEGGFGEFKDGFKTFNNDL